MATRIVDTHTITAGRFVLIFENYPLAFVKFWENRARWKITGGNTRYRAPKYVC